MYKHLILLLIVFSLVYPQYGEAYYTIEKKWILRADEGSEFRINATFIANDTYQKIIEISVPEEGEIQETKEGLILIFDGVSEENPEIISAKAKILVNFSGAYENDFPVEVSPFPPSGNAAYTDEISGKSLQLYSSSSMLGTVLAISEWVNGYVEYDPLSSQECDAENAFINRKGVCTAYTYLFISMMDSLGIKSRFVSGYVYSAQWQPHAWAEVYIPDAGWLPVDPTFGEVGLLDNTHIKSYHSEKKEEISDVVFITGDTSADFESTTIIDFIEKNKRQSPFKISHIFNEDAYVLEISVENPYDRYIFAPFASRFPRNWAEGNSTFLLFKPREIKKISYILNPGTILPGYVYTVPFEITIMDSDYEGTVEISVPIEEVEKKEEDVCAGFAFAVLPFVWLVIRNV
ncbi:transglutaminase domain-containing protein [Candidatus Micrarchaeota archaeon]|nr:transglutaminase domain-containing protein [Candidatus Micrarchaeota archaeon]